MKIWRLETRDSIGPFEFARSGSPLDWERRLEYVMGLRKALPWVEDPFGVQPTETHPHHEKDTPLPDWFDNHEWMVGTRSEDQFLFWFPKHCHNFFHKWGFRLVIYQCAEEFVHLGKTQVLFCVDQAVVLERRILE